MKILYFDKTYWIFLLLIVISGLFNNFVIYFILILLHELGHTITGLIFGYKIDKIKFYPFGGETKFLPSPSVELWKEFIVLIMGPIMQIIAYLILNSLFYIEYLKIYHYSLLFLNLLPIYPLDGGKLVNILLNYHFNYKKAFNISITLSLFLIIFFIIKNILIFNLNYILIMIVLILKIKKIYHNFEYEYNNFLIDRYLHETKYKKIKCINSKDSFYKNKKHYIKFSTESKYLQKYFENR